MLRLNAQGWNTPAIAEIFECHEHTVRATIRRWQDWGLGGLWESPGRGAKRKWSEADLQYLEQCLEQEERTYNSLQLAQKLASERAVKLSPERLRHLLQKGLEVETHAAQPSSKTRPQVQANQTNSVGCAQGSGTRRIH